MHNVFAGNVYLRKKLNCVAIPLVNVTKNLLMKKTELTNIRSYKNKKGVIMHYRATVFDTGRKCLICDKNIVVSSYIGKKIVEKKKVCSRKCSNVLRRISYEQGFYLKR